MGRALVLGICLIPWICPEPRAKGTVRTTMSQGKNAAQHHTLSRSGYRVSILGVGWPSGDRLPSAELWRRFGCS